MHTVPATILLLLALATSAQAATLHFVGDGESVALADGLQGVDRTWPMALEGHGDTETTFELRGPQDEGSYPNDAIPTYVYDGPVEIVGDTPVTVYVYVNDSNSLGCNSLDGQLFDGQGNALGPADFRHDIGGSDELVEVVMSFEGIAGTFDGLAFQAASPWSDCGALPYTFHWGSDAAHGRIEFTAPMAAPELRVVHADLDAAEASVAHQFNGTDDLYQFNWTNGFEMLNLTHDVSVSAGSASVTIRDAGNETMFSHEFTQDGVGLEQITDAGQGDWTIEIAYTDFTGSLRLGISEWIEASGDTDDGDDPDDGTDADGDDPAGNGTDDDSPAAEASPGLALPLLGLVLLALARRW